MDDSLDEGLITMDVGSDDATQHMVKEVKVPSALIQHAAGDAIKAMLNLRIPARKHPDWSLPLCGTMCCCFVLLLCAAVLCCMVLRHLCSCQRS